MYTCTCTVLIARGLDPDMPDFGANGIWSNWVTCIVFFRDEGLVFCSLLASGAPEMMRIM